MRVHKQKEALKENLLPLLFMAGIFFVLVIIGMVLAVAYANSGITTMGIYKP